ncbi:MAG: aminotransferase class I and II [Rhodothermales bacterium]|nr:aminotransferase class I and II [Rhodothermales bacterium]
MRTITVTRYVTPLREGGSLPAIVEADDDGMYVLKFRGAGQGPKALIAELVAGELARAMGLPVPEIVFANLDPVLARTEPDPEIQDLIRASGGLNLGMDYLPGSLPFDPAVSTVSAELASEIVWFDALVSNIDRTARNTNLLMWHRNLWMIDHGAALYVHHGPDDFRHRSGDAFPMIKDHVLLPLAEGLPEASERLTPRIDQQHLDRIAGLIPDLWLQGPSAFATPADHRAAYAEYLFNRLNQPQAFLEEAIRARSIHL